ncbi:efflux transporter outer membrane subunit [Trinickia soli]|uniref:RND transporter n=1 Tax=Trinickia soli TaxID=380675 RepID=A0A2N7W242_9BURK|nr:efflux transporter outer membrane subunit [Trinickia soli]PMS23477.1 RND transporter [Trinickia soli]CAB3707430.1 Outer membrane protein OprM [Trinickia soli]
MSIRRFPPRFAIAICAPAALCALAACTVGPDYHGAPPVAADALRASAFVRAPASGVVAAAPTVSAWWRALGDPQLDALVEAALAHNPDVHAAQARLREARAQLMGQQAKALPKVSADAAAVRMRSPDLSALSSGGNGSGNGGGRGPLQLYTAGLDASWEIDLFGGTRRSIEAASAQADALDADLADTQVSLAAEVAQAYIDLRDEQQRLVLARQSADLQQRMLTLTQERRTHGTAADVDVERLSGQVDTTRAALVPLDEQIAESLDRLAVLTGRAPGTLDAELATTQPLPTLPAAVEVGDPGALLRQRPDIRAAERRLASSNAQIGAHVADYFPKVSLMGDLGYTAADPGHLFRKSNFSWLGVPYLQWNVLDFGRTAADVRSAKASRDEASARYEHAVLAALQDANAALSRYGHQREHVARLEQVDASAQRASTLMQQRYRAGVATAIDLLDTERTQFSAQQDVIAGHAELLKDFVLLQKSLGMGWQSQAG